MSTQFGSASMLHRKLRIGFALTEKLLDFLHQLDIVGPSDGSKARKMRVSADDQEAVMMKLAVAVEGPVCQQEHLWGQPGQQPGALDGLTGGRTEGRTGQAACVGLTQHGQP
ncbi:DNA translocase FtsK [Streptomyces mirabilis]|uniref:DNA translocase FtsK n=1 Tax=Streptomyces mirabilis TaxID=68239 RepID=UPI0036BEA92F